MFEIHNPLQPTFIADTGTDVQSQLDTRGLTVKLIGCPTPAPTPHRPVQVSKYTVFDCRSTSI